MRETAWLATIVVAGFVTLEAVAAGAPQAAVTAVDFAAPARAAPAYLAITSASAALTMSSGAFAAPQIVMLSVSSAGWGKDTPLSADIVRLTVAAADLQSERKAAVVTSPASAGASGFDQPAQVKRGLGSLPE